MNHSLLVINASGRTSRSVTRRLTARFVSTWTELHPEAEILHRDLLSSPPALVNETWIAAAFAEPASRSGIMNDALRLSETLIEEIITADVILIGTPMYNFGMPATLKAWFDQVIRVGRTFAFEPESENPYRPLLASKPVIIATAVGDGTLLPGGALEHLNFLEPHLATMLGFIGLTDVSFVRVGDEEFQDDRVKRSIGAAETSLDELAQKLASSR